jgi:predicted transcriptional regulator
MSDAESSADKIRELADSGMTQVDIASSLGVTRQYVSKVLKDDRSKARAVGKYHSKHHKQKRLVQIWQHCEILFVNRLQPKKQML